MIKGALGFLGGKQQGMCERQLNIPSPLWINVFVLRHLHWVWVCEWVSECIHVAVSTCKSRSSKSPLCTNTNQLTRMKGLLFYVSDASLFDVKVLLFKPFEKHRDTIIHRRTLRCTQVGFRCLCFSQFQHRLKRTEPHDSIWAKVHYCQE